jgi:predicted GNAT family N-acyltransferase
MVEITKIETRRELQQAHEIRYEVFVVEQHVPVREEMDEFEDQSRHYLAILDGKPVGTARWRFTDKGIKLERFAVRKECRNKGIGSRLVEFILKDVYDHPEFKGKEIYLHSQLNAMPLYEKFSFKKSGNMFDEAGIMHYKMIKKE